MLWEVIICDILLFELKELVVVGTNWWCDHTMGCSAFQWYDRLISVLFLQRCSAQLARGVEYTDCISAEE